LNEVESILGCFHMLGSPKHLIMIKEPVHEQVDGFAYFKGIQPKHRRDTIVLTPHASDETVPHEMVHADLGLGELAAYPMGRVLVWKYRMLRNFPAIKSMVSKPVKYQKCSGCGEFELLHQRYGGRAEHYIKV